MEKICNLDSKPTRLESSKTMETGGLALVLLILLTLILLGCEGQKNFEPSALKGKISFNEKLDAKLVASDRYSARFKDGLVLTQDSRWVELEANEELLFINDSEVILTAGCKGISIVSLMEGDGGGALGLDRESSLFVETQNCVVSASKRDNLVAGVMADNTSFIYDLDSKKIVFREKGESIYAISSLNSQPLFLDTLVVFPTLDGRLSTVDLKEFKVVKNIIISTEKFLGNVIYLKIQGDELVAATHKRLYTLIRGESHSMDVEIRDLRFDGKFIYVLSLNGIIYKLDKNLTIEKQVKLPYASLNALVMRDGFMYTFENRGGFLVKLDLLSFDYEVFKLKSSSSSRATVFYTDDGLYIDKKLLDFTKDYEVKLIEKKEKPKKEDALESSPPKQESKQENGQNSGLDSLDSNDKEAAPTSPTSPKGT